MLPLYIRSARQIFFCQYAMILSEASGFGEKLRVDYYKLQTV